MNAESVPPETGSRESETGILLSVENFTVERARRYEDEEVCLRQVSLDLARGEILVLAGEQGSGVSMFCRWVAAGSVPGAKVLSGEIILDGEVLFALSRRRRRNLCRSKALYMGRPALATFSEKRSVAQNLRDFASARGIPISRLGTQDLHEKLYRVGCIEPEHLLEAPVRDLSMRDIARLLLLRVLLAEVDLLVCDWVTLEFDAVTERQFLEMLVHLQKEENLSVLFTSGKLRGVEEFADQVAIFYEGGILEKGDPAEVIAKPKFQYTEEFLECSPAILDLPRKLGGISREAIAEAENAVRGGVATLDS